MSNMLSIVPLVGALVVHGVFVLFGRLSGLHTLQIPVLDIPKEAARQASGGAGSATSTVQLVSPLSEVSRDLTARSLWAASAAVLVVVLIGVVVLSAQGLRDVDARRRRATYAATTVVVAAAVIATAWRPIQFALPATKELLTLAWQRNGLSWMPNAVDCLNAFTIIVVAFLVFSVVALVTPFPETSPSRIVPTVKRRLRSLQHLMLVAAAAFVAGVVEIGALMALSIAPIDDPVQRGLDPIRVSSRASPPRVLGSPMKLIAIFLPASRFSACARLPSRRRQFLRKRILRTFWPRAASRGRPFNNRALPWWPRLLC